MRDARHHDELLVRIGQLCEEPHDVVERGDAVELAAQDQHRHGQLLGVDQRQVGAHVDVGAGRHAGVERERGVGERLDDGLVRGAGVMAREDAADEVAVDRPAVAGAELRQALAPLGERRAEATSLAGFLGGLRGLKLVVLNGCATAKQVSDLLAAKIPVVIATSTTIRDDVAADFSSFLYSALGRGATIRDAFQQATNALRLAHAKGMQEHETIRMITRDVGVSLQPAITDVAEWPWCIYGGDAASNERLINPLQGETEVPTISIQALSESPKDHLDIQYRTTTQSDPIMIEPVIGYLDKMRNGGPIEPTDLWYTPFNFHAPALDVKIVNNTKQTIFLEEAVFMVERSKLDPSPVFFICGQGYIDKLPLVNLGWGDLMKCTLRFNLLTTSETASPAEPYKYSADVTDEVNLRNQPSIAAALVANGVDLGLSEDREWHKIKALGRFVDGKVIVCGAIDYIQQDGLSDTVQFTATVVLAQRGMGAPIAPSVEYNVKLQVEGNDYSVHVPISNALKVGDYDRFTFRLIAEKSSTHTFRLKLIYNKTHTFTSDRIQLALFISRADSNLLRFPPEMSRLSPTPSGLT